MILENLDIKIWFQAEKKIFACKELILMLIIMYLHFDQIFACKELILMLIIMYLQFDHIC